jgi:hypothetical protein
MGRDAGPQSKLEQVQGKTGKIDKRAFIAAGAQ